MRTTSIKIATTTLIAFVAITAFAAEVKAPGVGDIAPNFMLRDSTGTLVSLQLLCGEKVPPEKRKIVILDFFQTTCKPCLEELPELKSFHSKIKDNPRVQFFMVGVGEPADALNAFAAEKKVDIPMLEDRFLVAGKAYGALSFPTTVIIDGNKKIRFIERKRIENIEAVLNEHVTKILAEQ